MINIRDTLLKNILLTMLAACVLAALAVNLFIYPLFIRIFIDHVEEESVMIGHHMTEMIFPDDSLFDKSKLDGIEPHIHKLINEFNLYKLKIFLPNGETLFSTDEKDIKDINVHDYFHNIVASGKTYSKVVKKNTSTLEGKKLTADVVETYVPIMRNNEFIGALEIYYDITREIKVADNAVLLCNALSVGFIISFLLICLVIARKLDENITQKEQAGVFLKMTNIDLKNEIENRIQIEKDKEKLILKLEDTLLKLKVLKGLVPICSFCKNIRNDAGYWEKMEQFIEEHSDAEFSHGLCPACADKHYPDLHLNEDDETRERNNSIADKKDEENEKEPTEK